MHPAEAALPGAIEMLGWIERICARGIRRPGYPADRWVTDWVTERFRHFGLRDVRTEPVPLPRWEPLAWRLQIRRADSPTEALDLPCFPLPHSAPEAGGLEAPVVRLEDGPRGAIALDTVTLSPFRQTVARDLAIASHDPDGEFDTLTQVLPFGRQIQQVMEPAKI